jgi:hypothetical protein
MSYPQSEPSSRPGLGSSALGSSALGSSALGSSALAERQAALVAALVAGGPAPAGFDDAGLDATRRALLRKRAGAAATTWPLLAHSLGERWYPTFARFRAGREPVGGLRDGWHVARALRDRDELPAMAAAELADREAELRYDGRHPPRPRRSAPLRRFARRLGSLGGS